MITTQYKKELLYRKVNGKRFIGDYISKVTSLFLVNENDLEFMSLEDTDEILSFSKEINFKDERIKLLPHELSGFLRGLKNDNSSYYVFIDEDWKYCGSFVIPSLFLLNERFTFGKEIINDILLISTDLSKIISLDYYEVNNKYFIDITNSLSM